MEELRIIGRFLVVAGAIAALLGGILLLGGGIPWLGSLPGDISIQRRNFRFYFPLGTCIALSVLLTLILYLFRRR